MILLANSGYQVCIDVTLTIDRIRNDVKLPTEPKTTVKYHPHIARGTCSSLCCTESRVNRESTAVLDCRPYRTCTPFQMKGCQIHTYTSCLFDQDLMSIFYISVDVSASVRSNEPLRRIFGTELGLGCLLVVVKSKRMVNYDILKLSRHYFWEMFYLIN